MIPSWLDPNYIIAVTGPLAIFVVAAFIFCENAFLATSFLPGDSLLFVLGLALASAGSLDSLAFAIFLLLLAAIAGSSVSYLLGSTWGTAMVVSGKVPFLNHRWIRRSHDFFDRYGTRAIVLSRFVPIIRALVPFLAGTAGFDRRNFFRLNVIGGAVWVAGLLIVGYALGEIPAVKENLEIAILVVVVLTSLPFPLEMAREWWRNRRMNRTS